ncbi:MAG TPA: DUF4157 domain-containing protein [Haliangium sp.]|nr:DUF4157 domain-containing protein [Haliangium sp.]
MDKDDRQHGGPQQEDGSRESQRASRPAPGKVTRTSKLSSGRGGQVQRKAAASSAGAAGQPARSGWELTMDPWMDASHRGATALAERGQSGADGAVVARRAAGPGSIDGAHAGAVLDGARASSTGRPLEGEAKAEMESGFQRSFDDVRIHTDGAAGAAATDLNARAFTEGSDIYFNPGEYNPGSAGGKHLLAHELAHVAQGGATAAKGTGTGVTVSSPGDAAEVEADRAADTVVAGGTVSGLGGGAAAVHRDALGDLDAASRGNWIGDVDEGEALRRAAGLSEAEKQRLATEAQFRPTIQRLCSAFDAGEMMQLFAAVPYFELRWRIYWLVISGAVDELNTNQWRRVIGTASPEEMDLLRQYPDGYRAFVRNGPDNLVAPWDRLQALKQGWWTGDPGKIRFAVNSLDTAQRATVRGDDALMRAIMTNAGDANEKFRTATYLALPVKWAVFYLNVAGVIAALTPQQWGQMLSEAPKAEFDELVGWAEMWTLTQAHCPASVLQVVRQNTQDPNTVTTQLQDPVSLGLLISSLGPAGVLALSTQAGTDVAVNYGHIKTNNKVHPILDGLERGMRQGERTSAALKQWFDATTGETDVPTLEKMMSVRFGTTVGGTGGPGTGGGVHTAGAVQPWTAPGLRSAWTILERLPPGAAESNPAFLHFLRDGTNNGGYYAGRDTSPGWDNSVVIGLQGAPGALMSGDAIYGGTMPKFNEVVRHEMGHAVDNQLSITASIMNEQWAGAWVNHGNPTAWVDALIATGGGLTDPSYPATDVGDYRAAMIRAATNGTLFLTELNAIRAAKSPPMPAVASAPTSGPVDVLNNLSTWHHGSNFWSANAWKPQNTRNFVRGYGDSNHWWSFSNATMTAHRATDYQWRAPKEWFAEAYAVYYSEQETNPDVPVGARLRSVDQPTANFIAAQVDRGYSPQAMTGGGTRQAPGTPGGVGGGP